MDLRPIIAPKRRRSMVLSVRPVPALEGQLRDAGLVQIPQPFFDHSLILSGRGGSERKVEALCAGQGERDIAVLGGMLSD